VETIDCHSGHLRRACGNRASFLPGSPVA
jgi:hypothetical protein